MCHEKQPTNHFRKDKTICDCYYNCSEISLRAMMETWQGPMTASGGNCSETFLQGKMKSPTSSNVVIAIWLKKISQRNYFNWNNTICFKNCFCLKNNLNIFYQSKRYSLIHIPACTQILILFISQELIDFCSFLVLKQTLCLPFHKNKKTLGILTNIRTTP